MFKDRKNFLLIVLAMGLFGVFAQKKFASAAVEQEMQLLDQLGANTKAGHRTQTSQIDQDKLYQMHRQTFKNYATKLTKRNLEFVPALPADFKKKTEQEGFIGLITGGGKYLSGTVQTDSKFATGTETCIIKKGTRVALTGVRYHYAMVSLTKPCGRGDNAVEDGYIDLMQIEVAGR